MSFYSSWVSPRFVHILSFYLINLTYLSWTFCRWVYHCRKFWTTHFVVWNRICLWAWLDGYWSAGETRSLAGCWWSLPWTKEVCLEDSEESSKFKREQWSLFKFLQMHKWPTFWWSPCQRRSSNHWESISAWWRTRFLQRGSVNLQLYLVAPTMFSIHLQKIVLLIVGHCQREDASVGENLMRTFHF